MRGKDPECERRRPTKAIKEVAEEILAKAKADGLTVTMEQALALARDRLAQGDLHQRLNVWYDRRPQRLRGYEDFIAEFLRTYAKLFPPGSGAYQPWIPPMTEWFLSRLSSGAERRWANNPYFVRVLLTTCAPDAPDEVAAAIRAWFGLSFEGNDVAEAAERDRTTAIYQMGGKLRDALVSVHELLLPPTSLRDDPERIVGLITNLVKAGRALREVASKIAADPELTSDQKRVMSLQALQHALIDGVTVV